MYFDVLDKQSFYLTVETGFAGNIDHCKEN
jgi:hypothetical protein